jgi:hypothetical protein
MRPEALQKCGSCAPQLLTIYEAATQQEGKN